MAINFGVINFSSENVHAITVFVYGASLTSNLSNGSRSLTAIIIIIISIVSKLTECVMCVCFSTLSSQINWINYGHLVKYLCGMWWLWVYLIIINLFMAHIQYTLVRLNDFQQKLISLFKFDWNVYVCGMAFCVSRSFVKGDGTAVF